MSEIITANSVLFLSEKGYGVLKRDIYRPSEVLAFCTARDSNFNEFEKS